MTGNVSGSSGSTTGNAATATKIASITNSDIVQLTETQTLTNKTLTSPIITGTGAIAGTFTGDVTGNLIGNILDSNGNELVKGTTTASAVNEITIANAATTNGPTISATGSDTDIDLNIEAKGTGVVNTSGDLTVGGAVTFNEIVDNNSSISTDNTSDIVTINASSGKFRFKNGSTSKTINNSFVTTSSIIICTISGDNPAPRNILSSVAGSGSFVVTLDGNPLSDNFDVNFLIIN